MSEVHVTVTGSKNEATVVFDNSGRVPQPASAGVPIAVTKGANSQILAVRGTVSGVVADLPSGQ
jgi:hypothetical protein